MKKLFRYIVGISTVLFVVYWTLPYFEHIWLTEEELNLAAATSYGAYIPNHPLIYWSQFAAWVIASIGLFFFIPAARTAFLGLTAITSIANFFWGFLVLSPVSAGIGSIIGISDGAILTMAYLTSVSNSFTGSAWGLKK